MADNKIQDIRFKRSEGSYKTEELAWAAIDAITFKKGMPVIATYERSTANHGDSSVGAIYVIGTGDGVGKYQAFASLEDFLATYNTLENHIKTYNTFLQDEFNPLKQAHNTLSGEFNDYKEFVADEKDENVGSTALFSKVTINGKTYVRANYNLFSIGGISSGGLQEGGTAGGGSGSVVSYANTKEFKSDRIIGTIVIDGLDYPIILPSTADLVEYAGLADKSYVDTAILDAKDQRVDTLVADVEQLREDVDNLPEYTISSVTVSDENVKEAYQLKKGSTFVGSQIKIYKDSALQEVYLGSSSDTINATSGVITKNTVTDAQSLNFAYRLANGKYSLTKIDVSKFLTQSEFGNGLEVSSAGVVAIKIDSASQSNLIVGANGLKLSGVAQDSDVTTLKNRTITAGNGLTGGGNLTSDRTITLGTPSTITASSTNSVTTESHTHSIDAASTSKAGIVKLETATNSTSETTAATPKSVKSAYDKAVSAQNDLDTLEAKTITAGSSSALTSTGTLSSGVSLSVNCDRASIIIEDNKLRVSVIDGGTF